MHSLISYIAAVGVGLILAYGLTCAPELRGLRIVQLIFLPIAFAAALAALPDPADGYMSIGFLLGFAAVLVFIAVLLAPNLGHYGGALVSNFLDPQDWSSAEEEIALRPIVKLIDKDRLQDAMDELEALLKKHRPTYEALLLKAKLLHHFQHFAETKVTLLQMIRLSHATQQQLAVMELLARLEGRQRSAPKVPIPGASAIRISHELVLFQADTADFSVHRAIPAGEYQVEEILAKGQCWLVLKGESWGNAEACWEAVRESAPATPNAAKKGLLCQIVRMQEAAVFAIKGRPRHRRKEEVRLLHKEANRLIRQGDWGAALPVLQKASAADPDNYEIAYRFVQAARLVGASANPAGILSKVLGQSHWTEDEKRMLQQLKS